MYAGEPELDEIDLVGYRDATDRGERERQNLESAAGSHCVPKVSVVANAADLELMTELRDDERIDSMLTRAGLPSIPVALLADAGGGRVRPVTGGPEFELGARPNRAAEQAIVLSSLGLTVPRKSARTWFETEPPATWARSPWLRDHRAVVLREGRGTLAGQAVSYSDRYGVEVSALT